MNSKALYFVSLLFFFFVFSDVYATEYYIKEYEVNINVNLDNSLNIEEIITVNFNVPKRGIIRNIPYVNNVISLESDNIKNIVKIKNLKVDEQYKKSIENNNLNIRIGNPYKQLTGEKTYQINYNYIIGNDLNPEYDELYFNLIGHNWDTYIENVSFSIIMPKEFESEKLGFSRGSYGSINTDNIYYQVQNNKIVGTTNNLKSYEGLTVRLELPEGYFNEVKQGTSLLEKFFLLIPLIFITYSFYLWIKFGKEDIVIEPVEFYPPNGLNSLEAAYFYKGNASYKDVVSLLIYLADQGYLSIQEEKKDIYIIKEKEYEGKKLSEKTFINGLFWGKNKKVRLKSLENNFYKTVDSILLNQNSRKNYKLIHTEESNVAKRKILTMIIISVFLMFIPPIVEYGFVLFLPAIEILNIYKYIIFSFIANIFILIIFYSITKKRNDYGNEILGKLRGFKTFLENVEKNKLEELVLDDPHYFFNILPFTYVLGVSKKWIKKFEGIAMPEPDWYNSAVAFNYYTFNNQLNNVLDQAETTFTKMPSSSRSSGGFSGGGFSGGGSGGGGGSSW